VTNLIALEEIQYGDRQRKEFTPKDLQDLKRSIFSKGLLHAPVLSTASTLLAGERRIRAMAELHEEGNTFTYNNEPVPSGQVPYSLVADLSPADFLEAELEENIIRADLTWQEQTAARVRIHELRRQLNGPTHKQTATAQEVSKISGANVKTEGARLARALTIEKHKNEPHVFNAPNESAAYRAILDKNAAKFRAQLAALEGHESPHQIIHGDAYEELPKLPDRTFDAIICDPPYGIDADKMGKEAQHHYQDDADYALKFCEMILTQGFRLCKPQAVLFMFCDFDHFVTLKEYAQRQAWTVWRTPLVWHKGNEGGNAPWGRGGFIRTYEVLLFATKGGQELRNPGGSDVITFSRITRGAKRHAAEKPAPLLSHLVSLACLPGGTLLDPCAGSGSIIRGANNHRVRVTAVEKDEAYFTEALSRSTEEIANGQ
jgi:site-specific DNA-methyltransferase (adenine-specific)